MNGNANITINSLPPANAGSDVQICFGDSTKLQATGGTSYAWSPTLGLSSSNISNPSASPSSSITYVVTVTDNNGCSSTDNVMVSIYNTKPANAGVDQTICSGNNAYLNASGGIHFIWIPSTDLNNDTIPNPIASPNFSTNYTVYTTDINGCTSSDNVAITVKPGVSVYAGSDANICFGNSTTLSAIGDSGVVYSWSPAIGLSNPNIANPVANPIATTTYIVSVSNANGCSATDNVTVFVKPAVVANAGKDVTICSGTSTTLTATGAGTYQWSSPPGGTSASIIVAPLLTTTYTVTVTAPSGCSASDNVIVNVNLSPIADAGAHVTICNHDTVKLVASGGSTYHWNNGVNNNSNIVHPNTTTIYTVTVTDNNKCSSTDTVSVSVKPFEFPVITAHGPTIFCNTPVNVSLDANSGFSSYLWNNSSTLQNINVTSAGNYYVIGSVLNGCSGKSNTIHIGSFPAAIPPVIVANGPTSFCEKDTISVNLSTSNPYYNYNWSSGSQTHSIHVSNPGTYMVTVTDSNGCTAVSKSPVDITFKPKPVAYINYNVNGSIVHFYNSSLNDSTYYWNFGDGSTSTISNPIHTYSASGVYHVTFIATNDCGSDTAKVTIKILSGVGFVENNVVQNLSVYPIPTADLLNVSFEFSSSSIEVKLFNTLGQLLYNESDENFDGKYHKVFSLVSYPVGVYYLQINTDKGVVNKKFIIEH